MTSTNRTNLLLALIPTGIVLNIVLGVLVNVTKLPIYMDAVGTILVTLLIGFRAGAVVGIISFLLMSLILNPAYVYFIGTQVIIALYVYVCAYRFKSLQSLWSTVATGIGLGVVAAIVSAPVIVWVFGGVVGAGRDLITAVLMNSGKQIIDAVLLSGAASEPIDKTIQLLVACLLIRSAPRIILDKFPTAANNMNRYLRPKPPNEE